MDAWAVVAEKRNIAESSRSRNAENAIANGNIAISVQRDESYVTRLGRCEGTVVMKMAGIMSHGGLSTIIKMGAGTAEVIAEDWCMGDRVFREEVAHEIISQFMRVNFKMGEVMVNGIGGWATLSVKRGHNVKISGMV
jgi:hypothetical protein